MLGGTETLTRTADALRAAGCVFAEDEAELLVAEADDTIALDAMVAERVSGTPLEVVVGWALFGDLRIAIDPGVFVPRRRTWFLATSAIEVTPRSGVVVDVCCGSGAVGLAVATDVDDVSLYAADVDSAAVACATRNLAPVRGHTYLGDLFDPLPTALRGGVDVIVVNAPYVPTAEIAMMPPEARDHEPRRALDGGPDGVDVHRRVAAEAGDWLRPGGHLLIETSRGQAELTASAMRAAGLTTRTLVSDDHDATVAVGWCAQRDSNP